MQNHHLYALIDSAHSPTILPFLESNPQKNQCLYREPLTEALRAAAPYLVRLTLDTPFTNTLLHHAWGQSWGIFLIVPTSLTIEQLCHHCRTLNIVKDASGETAFFRYYDPRVLRVYLPTCTESEKHRVFGPVLRILVEAESEQEMLIFEGAHQGYAVRSQPLSAKRNPVEKVNPTEQINPIKQVKKQSGLPC